MTNVDYAALIGKFYGEIEVISFLTAVAITMTPRVPRDEHWTILVNEDLGVELTFTEESYFEYPTREYPPAALVLSNIVFHGTKTSLHKKCPLALPHDLSFQMSREEVFALLGEPEIDNLRLSMCRWDFPDHCISITRDRYGNAIRLALSLPV